MKKPPVDPHVAKDGKPFVGSNGRWQVYCTANHPLYDQKIARVDFIDCEVLHDMNDVDPRDRETRRSCKHCHCGWTPNTSNT